MIDLDDVEARIEVGSSLSFHLNTWRNRRNLKTLERRLGGAGDEGHQVDLAKQAASVNAKLSEALASRQKAAAVLARAEELEVLPLSPSLALRTRRGPRTGCGPRRPLRGRRRR